MTKPEWMRKVEEPYLHIDDTIQRTYTCAECKWTHTETDRGFAILGWGLLKRKTYCQYCLQARGEA